MGFEIERERLKELFEQTSDGVMVIDRTLRIVALNPAAERLTGFAAPETIGLRVCNEIAVCQNAEGFELCESGCPGAAAVERGARHPVLDVNLPGRGGQVIPATCVPMSAADGSPLAMILMRDVSERADLEERILAGERFDRVSGLYARAHFDELYRRELKLAERQQRGLAVVVSRVADDVLEGPEGDRAMRLVGEAIRASIRKVDIAGRYDHDTLATVLLDTDAAGAASLIGRVEAKLAGLRETEGVDGILRLAHGIGTVMQDGYTGFFKAARQRVTR